MRVIGLEQNGEVLIEDEEAVSCMGEGPADFVEWNELEESGVEERVAIGIVIR